MVVDDWVAVGSVAVTTTVEPPTVTTAAFVDVDVACEEDVDVVLAAVDEGL